VRMARAIKRQPRRSGAVGDRVAVLHTDSLRVVLLSRAGSGVGAAASARGSIASIASVCDAPGEKDG